MAQENDYYKTLGVNSESSDSDIKKAYRGLSMRYHPDRNSGNNEAEEKFKEINQAYEILGDKGSNNSKISFIKKLKLTNRIKVILNKNNLYKLKLNNV